jgi:glycosyltransferase involved in cell wall biosynthesis
MGFNKNEISPLVSVIIPAYNAEKFILETIESVQAQTYTNWEIIIVDDGSTDQTNIIIQQEAKKDTRIHYFHQENGRQGKARNLAIKHAKGEYLAFIDADDLWHPQKLEKQVNIFKENPSVDLVYCNGLSFMDTIQNVIQTHQEPSGLRNIEEQFQYLLSGKSLPNLSVIVNKYCVDKLGGFMEDSRLQNAEDYQMWLRLADHNCQMYGLPENLFYYRLHSNQVTHGDSMAFLQSVWAVYFAPLNKVSKVEKNSLLINRVQKYLLHHVDELSKEKFNEINALLRNPLNKAWKQSYNWFLYTLGKQLFKQVKY